MERQPAIGELVRGEGQGTALVTAADAAPRVEALLGVLGYYYAKGIFASEEIERGLWEALAFLLGFGQKLPTAQAIHAFRRRHRVIFLATIESALSKFRYRVFYVNDWQPSTDLQLLPPYTVQARTGDSLSMANIMDQMVSE